MLPPAGLAAPSSAAAAADDGAGAADPPHAASRKRPDRTAATSVFTRLGYATRRRGLRWIDGRRLPLRQSSDHLLGPALAGAAGRRAGPARRPQALRSHDKIG